MADLAKTNTFKIVGTLADLDSKTGQMKNGQDYISATATINSTIDGKSYQYEVEFFSSKVTKDGKASQLYINYSKLGEMLNKKVEVTGELRENRFWSAKTSQMASSIALSGKFVKGVGSDSQDCADFEVVGFIATGLTEKTKKDNNEVYRYDLVIGIANYTDTKVSLFTLNVEPENVAVVKGTQQYNVGQTVKLGGKLRFTVEKVTKEEENAFGAPTIKTYTNKTKNFFIVSGSNPITEEGAFYTQDKIRGLIEAYKADDAEKAAAAKNNASATEQATESKPAVTSRQQSLI